MSPANPDPATRPKAATTTSGDDYRERILLGATRSIARHGLERSSMASVAREAGVSRQTVYTYYSNREDVLRDAVTRSALELTEAALAQARKATTAGEFLVELTVGVFYGVREHAAISAMLYSLETPEGREMAMSRPILDIVADALSPLLEYDPNVESKLGAIAEASLRTTISLLTFPSKRTQSPDLLRQYLTDTIAPLVR